jgi:hypothetical protein
MRSLYDRAPAPTRADAERDAKHEKMVRSTKLCVAGAGLAFALAACQGSSGTGALSIPAPAYNAPAGPAAANVSRQQNLDGEVTLSPERTDIPLPALDGFSVTLALGTPPPASQAPAVASPSAAASSSAGLAKAAAASEPRGARDPRAESRAVAIPRGEPRCGEFEHESHGGVFER